jgi:cytochrome c oxidase accessory protein FixG
VYMEFVYRPIERFFLGKRGKEKQAAGWRRVAMYVAFVLVSIYLAHTFLAYFVGVDQLRHWIIGSPADHPAAFLLITIVSALMMFDFAYFREQTCIIACPYGRLQSVMTDRQSLAVSYDVKRGEPRGRLGRRKDEGGRMKSGISLSSFILQPSSLSSHGDCVDCDMCVSACPTGIDIRQGFQIECIACAQCIDACDAVMTKIKRPVGLIRYSSSASMGGDSIKLTRLRVVVYAAMVLALGAMLIYLITTQSPADVMLLRNLGRPFMLAENGQVENAMRVKLTNRTDHAMTLTFSIANPPDVRVQASQDEVKLEPGQVLTEPVQIFAPASLFSMGSTDVTLRVSDGDGVNIDTPCRLLGPLGSIPGSN